MKTAPLFRSWRGAAAHTKLRRVADALRARRAGCPIVIFLY